MEFVPLCGILEYSPSLVVFGEVVVLYKIGYGCTGILDLLESIAHGVHGDGAISVEGVCPMNPANHPCYTRRFRAYAASEISTDKRNGRLK